MKLIIEDDEGRKTVIPLVRDEISIGRLEGNTIRLTERNVSRHHARLLKQTDAIIIEDLKSSNGVRVNGERISAQTPVYDGDLIEIGDYDLAIEGLPRTEGATAIMQMPAPAEAPAPVEQATDPGRLSPEMTPRLVGVSGSIRGIELRLSRKIVTFGRADDLNDVTINDASVSRNHGRFQLENGVWAIADAGSSHGIRVNGAQVTSSPVQPGDIIEIGETRFRFCASGESYTPVADDAHEATVPVRRPGMKTAMMAGGVALILLVVAVVWRGGRTQAPVTAAPAPGKVENHCQKAQAALADKNWSEAIQSLSVAKGLGTQCPFDIDQQMKDAQANQEIKTTLDEADTLILKGSFRPVIEALSKPIPEGSPYKDAARAKLGDARLAGVKQLTQQVQGAIDRGRFAEARATINDLKAVDPESPTLPFLTSQLAAREAAAAKKAAETPAPLPGAAPVVGTPATPPPAPKVPTLSQEERNNQAQQLVRDGVAAMKAKQMDVGFEKLKAAIALNPAPSIVGLAHKNLGIALARAGQTDQAVQHLKLYIKLDPRAEDRAKIEEIIKQIDNKP